MNKIDETLAQHQHYKQECNIPNRAIFCHDNLAILQGINSECIDLIYLDPPFNKKKTFTAPIGSSAEGASFKDIFYQEDLKDEWLKTIEEDRYEIHELLSAVKRIEGRKSYNFCYLAYMAIRLIEMHRILKDTGGLYLHCDPTMSHYLKLLLDCIFGEKNFRNEVVWCYKFGGSGKRDFARKHDIIFRYCKTENFVFNEHLMREFETQSNWGQRADGKIFTDWQYIPTLNTMAKERTGYPTQKPLALLERIVKASSNEGDVVLDPFCGCATTCVAAEKLERHWIGIDISIRAYELVRERLEKEVWNDPDALHKYKDGYPTINYSVSPPKRTDSGQHTTDTKHVYVISHPLYSNEYKVGIARNLKSRLNSYQTADSERSFKVVYEKKVANYRQLEQHIHNTFPNKHEWVHGDLQEIIREIEKNAITQSGEEELFSET